MHTHHLDRRALVQVGLERVARDERRLCERGVVIIKDAVRTSE
jgi:hypothetical protein